MATKKNPPKEKVSTEVAEQLRNLAFHLAQEASVLAGYLHLPTLASFPAEKQEGFTKACQYALEVAPKAVPSMVWSVSEGRLPDDGNTAEDFAKLHGVYKYHPAIIALLANATSVACAVINNGDASEVLPDVLAPPPEQSDDPPVSPRKRRPRRGGPPPGMKDI